MLADLDFLVEMTDGSTAILECKTTNYNARDKWEYDGKPIVPVYYESQGRHYMAVMNMNRVYFCCLYGNNEEKAIIQHIDRDMDYKSELISLKEDFWFNNVQAQVPPPYFEDGGGSYTVTFNPSYKESILKDSLLRLKERHPEIYTEYVSISESRRFNVKRAEPKAA